MDKLIRAGKFFRLLDEQCNLSISNLTVIIMMTKVVTTPALNMVDIASAMVALLPYTVKKFKGRSL